MQQLREEDPLWDDLQEIQKAADRAAGLTRQLLAFSRKQVLQPRIISLNEVVIGMEKMLRRLIGEDIDLALALAPNLWTVKTDPGQIEQVIMNLAVNSRDAMPDVGKLTIETANVKLDADYTARHAMVTPGAYVLLAVSDTGCGMDEATQQRVFEPFFTTKEVGKGTGLGLSTAYGIIKQSGGDIWVYSEPGKGTAFKIYLPRTVESVEAAVKALSGEYPAVGNETVLVVEDEEAVRNIAVRVLRAAGYTVLAAANGVEALLACEEHQGEIDLLLTDVVMPQMSGRQLAEQVQQLRPELRVLYMSGYTDNAIVHHGILEAGIQYISKPFAPDDLTRKVRKVLSVKTDAGIKEQPLDKDALQALPQDILGRLRKAVIAARYDEIVELVETIRIADPNLAAGLRRMVDMFDYDGMRDLLR
jgi:CheY-like chemotaxis protein